MVEGCVCDLWPGPDPGSVSDDQLLLTRRGHLGSEVLPEYEVGRSR